MGLTSQRHLHFYSSLKSRHAELEKFDQTYFVDFKLIVQINHLTQLRFEFGLMVSITGPDN
jgi:hypothetical protein